MAEEENGKLDLYPAWKQAVKDFLAANFQPGQVVEMKWFFEHFKLEMPKENTPLAEAERTQFIWLRFFEPFRMELLREHKIYLENRRGIGYEWVKPQEQSGRVDKAGQDEIQKTLGKMYLGLACVRMDELSDKEKRENLLLRTRQAQLAVMVKKVRKLKGKESEPPALKE